MQKKIQQKMDLKNEVMYIIDNFNYKYTKNP